MGVYEEKKNLLLDMISYAAIDGKLSKKDYDFLFTIANELHFEKGDFIDLLSQDLPKLSDGNELVRILQFYRLVLFFQNEGALNRQDSNMIYQIAISMGLNPEAVKRLLIKMKKSPSALISDDFLFKLFRGEAYF